MHFSQNGVKDCVKPPCPVRPLATQILCCTHVDDWMPARKSSRTSILSATGRSVTTSRLRLGDRVRERRIARGWTQDELGQKCELHRTFIGSVERGERNISILNLRVIAGVLRVSLAELFAEPSAK